VNNELKFQKAAQYAVLFLLGTIPFFFGAVHPIVTGAYTSFILLVLGTWLLLNARYFSSHQIFSVGHIIFFIFIFWIVLSIVPLPMSWLKLLSPARISFLQATNQLAGTNIQYAPTGYNGVTAIMTAAFLFALLLYVANLKILLKSDRSFLKKLLYVCIGIGLLEAIYGILQSINPHLGVLWLSDMKQFNGMARGTIIYKNQYAALLNMIWPLAVGAAFLQFKHILRKKNAPSRRNTSRRKSKKKHSAVDLTTNRRLRGFLFLFFASVIMLAVLFSQSRGGIISMALILSILLALLPVSLKNKLLLFGFFLLFSLSYGSIIGFNSILDRFMLIHQGGEGRFNIWLSSLPMLQDHLLVGTGIGSYMLLSSIYLKQFPENIVFDRAHNDYLEFAIELGLPFSLFFFCICIIFFLLLMKRIWPYTRTKVSKLPSPALISIISTAAITGFVIHGTVDFGWRLPANLLYFITLLTLAQHGAQFTSYPAPADK
jgi:O-antigen ligase